MPSRNRVPNAAEFVSRSLKWTRPPSPKRSAMVNASRHCPRHRLQAPAYDEQIIARRRRRVQRQPLIWFPSLSSSEARVFRANEESRPGAIASGFPGSRFARPAIGKKEPPFPAALKLITGRRQTEWTGATRCPNEDNPVIAGKA